MRTKQNFNRTPLLKYTKSSVQILNSKNTPAILFALMLTSLCFARDEITIKGNVGKLKAKQLIMKKFGDSDSLISIINVSDKGEFVTHLNLKSDLVVAIDDDNPSTSKVILFLNPHRRVIELAHYRLSNHLLTFCLLPTDSTSSNFLINSLAN